MKRCNFGRLLLGLHCDKISLKIYREGILPFVEIIEICREIVEDKIDCFSRETDQ